MAPHDVAPEFKCQILTTETWPQANQRQLGCNRVHRVMLLHAPVHVLDQEPAQQTETLPLLEIRMLFVFSWAGAWEPESEESFCGIVCM